MAAGTQKALSWPVIDSSDHMQLARGRDHEQEPSFQLGGDLLQEANPPTTLEDAGKLPLISGRLRYF